MPSLTMDPYRYASKSLVASVTMYQGFMAIQLARTAPRMLIMQFSLLVMEPKVDSITGTLRTHGAHGGVTRAILRFSVGPTCAVLPCATRIPCKSLTLLLAPRSQQLIHLITFKLRKIFIPS